jgi:uncharacterized membrane protein YhaH (DUF805 family)
VNYMLMPFRRYADFNGRSRRSEFWMFVLLQIIVFLAFMVLMVAAGGALFFTSGDPAGAIAAGGMMVLIFLVFGIYWLGTLIPYYAVTVRRLHDTNRSGWWAFGPLLLSIVTQIFAGAAAVTGDPMAITMVVGLFSLINFGLGIVVLVFMCLDGTPGPNQYGHDPKYRGYEHTFA